jgi:hypothetical protein
VCASSVFGLKWRRLGVSQSWGAAQAIIEDRAFGAAEKSATEISNIAKAAEVIALG